MNQGRRLPPGKQWIAHELRGSRAAKRRLSQMAKGKIDERQMMPSAKLVAPALTDQNATQAMLDAVNEAIAEEMNVGPDTYKQSMGDR